MVTEKEYIYNDKYFGAVALYGTSNDSKPVTYGNGSIFVEVDTGKIYCFNASANEWNEFPNLYAEIDTLKTKVDAITYQYVNGVITESPQTIGNLAAGEWACSVVYPLNLDITVATNADNDVIVTSPNYTGVVITLCFKV